MMAGLLRGRYQVTVVSSAPERVFEMVFKTPALPASHTAKYQLDFFGPTVVQLLTLSIDSPRSITCSPFCLTRDNLSSNKNANG